MTTKACLLCGGEFERDARYSRAYFSRQKYCSQECAGHAQSAANLAARPSKRDAFEAWVDRSSDCWVWAGARDKNGYGAFNYDGKSYRAPVVALELDGRSPAKGEHACHHCDNPACVRPSHLYPGTPKQNAADAKQRGRVNLGRKAKLTPDAVRAIRSATGTHEAIAAEFGVSRANVSMIREGRTWRDVI